MKIIIVGASPAGLAAAMRLRRLDEDAHILVVDERRMVPGLPRAETTYNIDVKMSAAIIWPEDAPEGFAGGKKGNWVAIEDKLTGILSKEDYDKIIVAYDFEDANYSPARGSKTSEFTLSSLGDFALQWERVDRYVTDIHPADAIIYGDDMVAAVAAGQLLFRGLMVTIVAPDGIVAKDLDFDMACHITAHIEKSGAKIAPTAGRATAALIIHCVKPQERTMPMYVPAPTSAGDEVRGYGLDTVSRNVFNGQQVDIPALGPLKGRALAATVAGMRHNARYETSINLRQYDVYGHHVAIFGLTEKELNAARLPYIFSVVPVPDGFLKMLYNSKGDILGFLSMGQDALHYANSMALIARLNCNINDVAEMEMTSVARRLQILGKVGQNVLERRLKMVYWDEVAALDMSKTQIIDVRPLMVSRGWKIEGSINIPLETLRRNFHKIDPAKEIIVCCNTGEDSYIASRILSKKVPNVRHLVGGLYYYREIVARIKSDQ